MLDGGIADSIPLLRARELGFDNNLVVLTRNKGYRKSEGAIHLPPFVYGRYPQLREAIRRRNVLYNEQLALVERLEDEGTLTVLRPERPIEVGRIERDTRKLAALYDEGYACAQALQITTTQNR